MIAKNSFRLFLLLTILTVTMAGCGKIGPPRIPKKTEPSPVSDLVAKLSCTKIVLTWTRPFTETDGSVLKKIEKMELFREIKMPDTGKSAPSMDVPGQPEIEIEKNGLKTSTDEKSTEKKEEEE